MNQPLRTRLFSLALAGLITLGMLGSLDAIATSRQSAHAVLAQPGGMQFACEKGMTKS